MVTKRIVIYMKQRLIEAGCIQPREKKQTKEEEKICENVDQ